MSQSEHMENTLNIMPEMSGKFDVVMKQLMIAKKEMGSAVKKDSTNPFHKSTYASLAAHLELCENALDKHGLIMLQTINGSHERAILIATICHIESGQWIRSYLPLLNPKADCQGLGASITYMRRYSINTMLGLTAEDDDGESACFRRKTESKNTQDPKTISIHQVQALGDALAGDDDYKRIILEHYKIKSLADLTPEQHQVCLRKTLARRQKQLKTGTN
jgi:hypothetical protein